MSSFLRGCRWLDPSPCCLLPRRRWRVSLATSRQEPWPKVSHELKRDAQKHLPFPAAAPLEPGRGWLLAGAVHKQHRQRRAPCGLFLGSETMGRPRQGAAFHDEGVCLSAQPPGWRGPSRSPSHWDMDNLGKQLPGDTGGQHTVGMQSGCGWDAARMPSHHLLWSEGRAGVPGEPWSGCWRAATPCHHAERCNRPSIVGC